MSTARKLVTPLPFVPSPQHRAVFSVFENSDGRWCAERQDGMTGGIFFDRDAAIRFARRESIGMPALVLHMAPARSRSVPSAISTFTRP